MACTLSEASASAPQASRPISGESPFMPRPSLDEEAEEDSSAETASEQEVAYQPIELSRVSVPGLAEGSNDYLFPRPSLVEEESDEAAGSMDHNSSEFLAPKSGLDDEADEPAGVHGVLAERAARVYAEEAERASSGFKESPPESLEEMAQTKAEGILRNLRGLGSAATDTDTSTSATSSSATSTSSLTARTTTTSTSVTETWWETSTTLTSVTETWWETSTTSTSVTETSLSEASTTETSLSETSAALTSLTETSVSETSAPMSETSTTESSMSEISTTESTMSETSTTPSPTKEETPTPTINVGLGQTTTTTTTTTNQVVTEIRGSMGMDVAGDVCEFVNSADAALGIQTGLADTLQVPADYVAVGLEADSGGCTRRLVNDRRALRGLSSGGSVTVTYIITIPEDAPAEVQVTSSDVVGQLGNMTSEEFTQTLSTAIASVAGPGTFAITVTQVSEVTTSVVTRTATTTTTTTTTTNTGSTVTTTTTLQRRGFNSMSRRQAGSAMTHLVLFVLAFTFLFQ